MKRQIHIEALCILCIQYLRICRMASSYFFPPIACYSLGEIDVREKLYTWPQVIKGQLFRLFWIIQQYLKTAIPDIQSTGVIFGGSSSRRLVEPMRATMQRIMAKSAEKRAALAGALENMAARKGGKFVQIWRCMFSSIKWMNASWTTWFQDTIAYKV